MVFARSKGSGFCRGLSQSSLSEDSQLAMGRQMAVSASVHSLLPCGHLFTQLGCFLWLTAWNATLFPLPIPPSYTRLLQPDHKSSSFIFEFLLCIALSVENSVLA